MRTVKFSSLDYANTPALRRTQTDGASSNYGHNTAIDNKLDPQYDSDLDHRAVRNQSRSVAGYKCHACGALNPIHGSNIGSEPGPRHGDNPDYHGAPTASASHGPHGGLEQRGRSEFPSGQGYTSAYSDSRDYRHQTGPAAQIAHSSEILNKLDPVFQRTVRESSRYLMPSGQCCH